MAQEISADLRSLDSGAALETPDPAENPEIPDPEAADIVQRFSSGALAYLGDSVYELNIRSRIMKDHRGNAGDLNKKSKALTNAKVQAQIADAIKDLLTQEELSVYRRGRNYKSPSVPKSCTVGEYRKATGLEALMAYLYLLGRNERIEELISEGIHLIRK